MFSGLKKKVLAVVLCGALVLTMGTGVAFSQGFSDDVISNMVTVSIQAPQIEGDIWFKLEDGVINYSTDGGENWLDVPMGAGLRLKHPLEGIEGVMTVDFPRIMMQVKEEDGVRWHSTDGGETWNEVLPGEIPNIGAGFGLTRIDFDPEKMSMSMERALVKVEDGVRYFSSDGGVTWNELPLGERPDVKARFERHDGEPMAVFPRAVKSRAVTEGEIEFISPEGDATWQEGLTKDQWRIRIEGKVKHFANEDGQDWDENLSRGMQRLREFAKVIGEGQNEMPKPERPAHRNILAEIVAELTNAPEGMKVWIKVENGVKSYSTDDGVNWSEVAPEGLGNVQWTMDNVQWTIDDAQLTIDHVNVENHKSQHTNRQLPREQLPEGEVNNWYPN